MSIDPRVILVYRSLEELSDLELKANSYSEAFETILQVFLGVLGVNQGGLLVRQFQNPRMCEVVYKRGLNLPAELKIPANGLNAKIEERLHQVGVGFVQALHFRGQPVGVVLLGEKMSGESYTLEDRQLIQPVANLVGMVLANFLEYYASLSESESLKVENRHLRTLLETRFSIKDVVGISQKFQKIIRKAEVFSREKYPCLLVGEYGTGKEFLARFIHQSGNRSAGAVFVYDHDTIPSNLMLRHAPGELMAAEKERLARMRGGTIVLLGIENFDAGQQEILVRFSDPEEVAHLAELLDVRLILTSHWPLPKLISTNRLNRKLYDLVKDHTVELVPLAERREDIPILAHSALETLAVEYQRPDLTFSPAALRYLVGRDYSRNIRELEQLIEQSVVSLPLGQSTITLDTLQGPDFTKEQARIPTPITFNDLEEIKGQMVHRALKLNNWKKIAAAEVLGVTRQTVDHLVKRYGIFQP